MRPLVQRADAAAYVLGALDPGERAAFERLVWRDVEIAHEVAILSQVTALLAYAAPPAQPPGILRERVMALAGTCGEGGPTAAAGSIR
ncbi:MAG: hypothetical protein IPK85_13540 [Gemmatimonadetes bacterium]|nr:hypothetical protein [Gemmatimonadota bacterium]